MADGSAQMRCWTDEEYAEAQRQHDRFLASALPPVSHKHVCGWRDFDPRIDDCPACTDALRASVPPVSRPEPTLDEAMTVYQRAVDEAVSHLGHLRGFGSKTHKRVVGHRAGIAAVLRAALRIGPPPDDAALLAAWEDGAKEASEQRDAMEAENERLREEIARLSGGGPPREPTEEARKPDDTYVPGAGWGKNQIEPSSQE